MKLIHQQKGNHILLIDFIFSLILIAFMAYSLIRPFRMAVSRLLFF